MWLHIWQARRWLGLFFTWGLFVALLPGSQLPPGDPTERVRAFTRQIEFDYITWTLQAIGTKLTQEALGLSIYLPEAEAGKTVRDYMGLVAERQTLEGQLTGVYADPQVADPETAAAELRARLAEVTARQQQLGPLAETILQSQISAIAAEMGLALGGQPFPPVLYHSTPVPAALIISPRNTIRQDQNISVLPDLSTADRAALEDKIARALDVSALVVPIGGIGTYPTMVYQTSNLDYLAEVVSHEWIHNFLNLRPLGLHYLSSGELRTINETTASLAGKEIGQAVIARFYPDLVPPPPAGPAPAPSAEPPAEPAGPPPFDFNAEMRITRIHVDDLLDQGKIATAEAYMEVRRRFFWDNGYQIRKLNQAYFAFYGAYADAPGGGAAGANPVGEAVRTLRARSASLAEFLNRISWVTSFEDLQALLEK